MVAAFDSFCNLWSPGALSLRALPACSPQLGAVAAGRGARHAAGTGGAGSACSGAHGPGSRNAASGMSCYGASVWFLGGLGAFWLLFLKGWFYWAVSGSVFLTAPGSCLRGRAQRGPLSDSCAFVGLSAGRVCLHAGGSARLPDLYCEPQGGTDPGTDQGKQILVRASLSLQVKSG